MFLCCFTLLFLIFSFLFIFILCIVKHFVIFICEERYINTVYFTFTYFPSPLYIKKQTNIQTPANDNHLRSYLFTFNFWQVLHVVCNITITIWQDYTWTVGHINSWHNRMTAGNHIPVTRVYYWTLQSNKIQPPLNRLSQYVALIPNTPLNLAC